MSTHGFFLRTAKFEKINPRTFFYKLIEGFVNEGFSNLWEPPMNKIYGTQDMTLCNSMQAILGATRFKEQNVKTTCESLNDRFRNHEMSTIVKKIKILTIEVETKITNLMGHDLAIIVM
jgi:hypothetical protein